MEDKIKEVLTPEDFGVPGECAAEAMNYAKYMAAKSAMDAERYRWLRSGLEAGRSEAHQIARAGCGLDAAIDAAMNGANVS